jgi:FkbM family methyltransferase
MKFLSPSLPEDRAFGAFDAEKWRGFFLDLANSAYPARKHWSTKLNRLVASVSRKIALAGRQDPIDRSAPWGGVVRLYGHDNTTDKYLMYGLEPVHRAETEAMKTVASNITGRPVYFCDIGGNSGLYTVQTANALGGTQNMNWLCVEPNPKMQARLKENLALNGYDNVRIATCALSDRDGEIEMETDFSNLGKVRIPLDGAKARKPLKVEMTTLAKMLSQAGHGTPDIVKVDIEGHEQIMFEHFWTEAPDARPSLIILEMWPGKEAEQIACMERGGYSFVSRPSENAIFLHESYDGPPIEAA